MEWDMSGPNTKHCGLHLA